jgi:hypothetical protein
MKKIYALLSFIAISSIGFAQTCPASLASTFLVMDTCNSANYAYTATITYDPAHPDTIEISNFGGFTDPVMGIVDCSDSTIILPTQTIAGGTLVGTGSFANYDSLVFSYVYNNGTTLDNCEATYDNTQPNGIAKASVSKVKCFPVPSSSMVEVSFALSNAHVDVVNSLGQIVYSKENVTNKLTLSKDDIGTGIYFLRIYNNPQSALVSKIIFE